MEVGVVGAYDTGGTAVTVTSCSGHPPGDQASILSQPSASVRYGCPHTCANLAGGENLTPASGGSDASHKPSSSKSFQAAKWKLTKQSERTTGVEVERDAGAGVGGNAGVDVARDAELSIG